MPSHIEHNKMTVKSAGKNIGGTIFDAMKKALSVNEDKLSNIEENTQNIMKATKKSSGEAEVERKRAAKITQKNEEKQTSFLAGIAKGVGALKDDAVKTAKKNIWNWIKDNWGKIVIGLTLLLVPMKSLVKAFVWAKNYFQKNTWEQIGKDIAAAMFLYFSGKKILELGAQFAAGFLTDKIRKIFNIEKPSTDKSNTDTKGKPADTKGKPAGTKGGSIDTKGKPAGTKGGSIDTKVKKTPEQIKKDTATRKETRDKLRKNLGADKKRTEALERVRGSNKKTGGGWFKKLIGKLGKFGQTIMKLGASVVRGLVASGPWGWGILLTASAGLLIYSYWDEISTGFSNMGKSIKEGIDSLISKFKSFDIMKSMEGFIRKVPGFGNLIADAMFDRQAKLKNTRTVGSGGDVNQMNDEEREVLLDEEIKNAGKGGAGEIIKPQRSKEERLEENERLIANTKARMATIAKRRGGATAESIGRMNSLNEQLKGLQDVNKSIKAEGSKATPVKSGGGSAIRKIDPKTIGIDWDFISKKEGGSALKGYVPDPDGSKSGVTIATGFDLGARNIKDLEGLPQDLQSKLAPYLGLQGQNAAAMLRQRPLEITAKEAKQIDKMSKGAAVNKLQREWNKRAEETGGKRFEDLSSAQQTVAASVAFQYGSLSKTPNFRKAMQSGDWTKAINELNNFGDSYSTRRKSEAQYLMASLDPNKKSQAMNQLHTANAEARMGGRNGTTVVAPTITKVNNSSSQGLIMPARAQDTRWDRNTTVG